MSDGLIRSLLSKYECSLDDKRRFSLPPPLRPLFDSQVTPSGLMHHAVILPWFDGPLALLPLERWKQIEDPLLQQDFTSPERLKAKRAVLSRAVLTHTDPEGRILLSPEHLAWIGIPAGAKDKVVVVGLASHVEVWKAETWAAQEHVTPDEYEGHLGSLFQSLRSEGKPETDAGTGPVPGGT